jgi:hypothetical protein
VRREKGGKRREEKKKEWKFVRKELGRGGDVVLIITKIDISTNSRKSSSMRFPESGNFMEVDIWLPDHNVCFEFQVMCQLN